MVFPIIQNDNASFELKCNIEITHAEGGMSICLYNVKTNKNILPLTNKRSYKR